MKLAVVTPSCIDSQTRAKFAQVALASLRAAIGEDYLHVVVDDDLGPASEWHDVAKKLYVGQNTMFVQRSGRHSNTSALRQAVQEARGQGAELLFIHLDDNVYVPLFGDLLKYACHAFARDEGLMEVLFTGPPILFKKVSTPQLGNCSRITVSKNQVSFGNLRLSPTRYRDYTLWWSRFHVAMVDGTFWPIYMWQTLYRATFLERVLTFENVRGCRSLGRVELYYKNKDNWRRMLESFPGKLGYINMQFGGLEMHRHGGWRELIRFPNVAVR